MDLEVVFKELGQFGRYQALQYALLTIPIIASAFEEMSYIFTTSEVNYRCLVPECECTNNTQYLTPWLKYAVPFEGDPPEPAWCERHAVRPLSHNTSHLSCSPDIFLTNVTQPCDHWVFETQERTIATEFELFCEDHLWQRTMIGTINNLGLIANYIIVCYLSDRYGRRKTLLTLTAVQGVLVLIQSFASSYIAYFVLEFLVCFCSTFNTAFILALEVVGGDKRIFANSWMNMLYSLGEVLLALIMWWAQDFRVLLRFISGIKLINLVYMWMITESVHWYLTKEHYSQVVDFVKTMARVNNRPLSESLQYNLDTLIAKGEKAKNLEIKPPSRSVINELLKSPQLLWRFALCSLIWLVNVFVYFGFGLMSVTLGGNKYVNFILISLVEVPAYAVMWLGMDWGQVGRKTTLSSTCFLAAVPCFVFLFVPSDADATQLCLFLVGKFAITISYTVVYEVGAEVFPTELRQSMVGLCCAVACLGGLFAPQIPLLALYVNPMLLFFWLAIAAGCLSLMLPETQGHGLPDTIMQAAKLGTH